MSEAVGQDPYVRSRGEIIPERNTIVPSWAKPIRNYSIIVKRRLDDGSLVEVPPGFTIGEVAPEFRWAIEPETGEVMSHAEFRAHFERWYAAHYTMRGERVEGEPLSIPDVIDFVSRRVHPDDDRRVVPMAYDPNRPMISKPIKLYDRHGENPKSPEELKEQKKVSDSGAQMKQLVQMLEDGDISTEVFAKRAKMLYGGSVVIGDDGADSAEPVEAEPPPPGFEPKVDREQEDDEDLPQGLDISGQLVPMDRTLCGKVVKKRGKHVHERQCDECQEIRTLNLEPDPNPEFPEAPPEEE